MAKTSSPATLTWIGGGNNDAMTASEWSPHAVPQHGDTLIMKNGTMNLDHTNLANDTLTVPDGSSINSDSVVLNLDKSSLKLNAASTFSEALAVNAVGGKSSVDFINSSAITATIDLAEKTSLVVTGSMRFQYFGAITGHTGSTLVNNGTLSFSQGQISGKVSGRGSINLLQSHDGPGHTSIDGTVGARQSVNMETDPSGTSLTLVKPKDFHGEVNIKPVAGFTNGYALITLDDITATSYEMRDNILTLYDEHRAVDTLRLDNHTADKMYVSQIGSNVNINFNPTVPPESVLPIGS